MDKSMIRNGIIKKLNPDTKYLYSFYGYDTNRQYNILFIVTDKSLYLWEDVGNNLKIRIKYYKNIKKINLIKETLFINFEDENFALNQISKADGEIVMLYRFVKDFYDKALGHIANNAVVREKESHSAMNDDFEPEPQSSNGLPKFKKREPEVEEEIPHNTNGIKLPKRPSPQQTQEQHQRPVPKQGTRQAPSPHVEDEIPDNANKRIQSLAMFSTPKSPIAQNMTIDPNLVTDNSKRTRIHDDDIHNHDTNMRRLDSIRDMDNLDVLPSQQQRQKPHTPQGPQNASNQAPEKPKSKLPIIIGIIGFFVILVIFAVILAMFILGSKDKPEDKNNGGNQGSDNTSQGGDSIFTGGYTKTKKEAELKLDDLNKLQEVSKKDKIIYTLLQQTYDDYKANPKDFDYDAAKQAIEIKFNDYKDSSINNVQLKSTVSGNVDGNYLFEELKKNENYLSDVKTSMYLNLDNKFGDNGRIVELETLLQNTMTANQTISSLIKDEINIFTDELNKYNAGSITDEEINVENNDNIHLEN